MRFFYSEDYNYGRGLPLQQVHGFLLDKPRRIRDHLMRELALSAGDFEEPPILDEAELAAVHSDRVMRALERSSSIAAALEMPLVAMLPAFLARRIVVLPQLRATAGTCAAMQIAARGEWALNLSGGYHHARPDLSHGFCMVNDVAMAVHALRRSGERKRVLILDLDLHQGDGNAVAFADAGDVFTASLHEQAVFPEPKAASDIDVGLPPEVDDAGYAEAIEALLARIAAAFEPELLVYVAGSDPYAGDPLGSLRVSRDGMLERDRRVGRFALEQGCGLVALPAGGYSDESPAITAAGFAALARMAPG